jgi:hypothetical protein
MPHDKPFHRNVRGFVPSNYSRSSSWAYIDDKDYANEPLHYSRAYLIIQADLEQLFEFVEPSDACLSAYSYRMHGLLMRTCIEVEANCKAIFKENTFTPRIDHFGHEVYNMSIYKKIDKTHHLSASLLSGVFRTNCIELPAA